MPAMEKPTAIVTGSGSGIGRALSIGFAREGHRLVLVGRTETKLLETMELIGVEVAHAPEVLVIPADLSDPEQAAGVVDMTLERWGRVDVLVSNAGVGTLRPIETSDPDFVRSIFADNAMGAATLIWRAWPAFVRQPSACVALISSMAAHDPFPGFFAYAAAKSALESFARSIVNDARAARARHIRAFAVAPGAVETPMLRASFSETSLPPSRTLDPEAVASVVVDAVMGRRHVEPGETILLPSP